MSDELLLETLKRMENGVVAARDPKIVLLFRLALVFGILMLGLFALSPLVKVGVVFNAAMIVVSTCFIGVTGSCAIAGVRNEIRSRRLGAY